MSITCQKKVNKMNVANLFFFLDPFLCDIFFVLLFFLRSKSSFFFYWAFLSQILSFLVSSYHLHFCLYVHSSRSIVLVSQPNPFTLSSYVLQSFPASPPPPHLITISIKFGPKTEGDFGDRESIHWERKKAWSVFAKCVCVWFKLVVFFLHVWS